MKRTIPPFHHRVLIFSRFLVQRALVKPLQLREELRIRCLYFGIKFLMWAFDGVELVIEAEKIVLVHGRGMRSGKLLVDRQRWKMKRGEVFLYLGDWTFE